MNESLQYIDDKLKNETQLVPISAVTEIIKIVQDIIPKNNENLINNNIISEQKIYEQELKTKLDIRRNDYLSYDKVPKIISSVVALLITSIWFFPSTIESHPILSRHLEMDSVFFTLIWLVSIAITSSITSKI